MGPNKKRKRELKSEGVSLDGLNHTERSDDQGEAIVERNPKRAQRTLFVRALPPTATTEKLIEHFSEAFPIKHATIVTDPTTKQSKGYGFITFADAEDAQRAAQDYNDTVLDGRKLKLEVAESRHRDAQNGLSEGHYKQSLENDGGRKVKRPRNLEEQKQSPPKLIIRNLPWSIKDSTQLTRLFLSYGKVKHAVVPQTKPGLQAGFGFVTIRGRKNAENALKGVNGLQVDGRTLAVDWAVDREAWQAQTKASRVESGMDSTDRLTNHQEKEFQREEEEEEEDQKAEEEEYEGQSDDVESAGSYDSFDGSDVGEAKRMPYSATTDAGENHSSTLFIRNIPFSSTDESLHEHFGRFGNIRYARVVVDPVTERSRGTAFVCFYRETDAEDCLRLAPRDLAGMQILDHPKRNEQQAGPRSVLQNEEADPTGKFTIEGRILQVSRAVDRSEATRLTQANISRRGHRDNDKRRLYLLSEGTISTGSSLYSLLSPSEIAMREQSAKQRKTMIQNNPSLNLSLTRLSVRNIPRSITSKDLKQLAREAVVGFASDVKNGKRERISKEELARGGDEMTDAEKDRKAKGKGLVKQAKIVFEGREGAKVQEEAGAGRSRGYGFIEYHTHRSALMALRWLNGHAIDHQTHQDDDLKSSHRSQDKKKRLIVEFAIENAQVVNRRKQREQDARDPSKRHSGTGTDQTSTADRPNGKASAKRGPVGTLDVSKDAVESNPKEDQKLAIRSRIIAKKRAQRRDRRKVGRAGR